MKKGMFLWLLGALFLVSCGGSTTKTEATATSKADVEEIKKEEVLTNQVLTAEERDKMTPKEVLDVLKQGNKDFVENNLTVRNNTETVREAALGQFPKAVILSCLDSRVPVEDVFHRGIGDLFVARIAGNIVNDDILGSMEFACKASGSKLIVVLGHEYCGAIKGAISGVKLGNLTGLLKKIEPAVAEAGKDFKGEKTADNPEFVQAVCDDNVHLAIEQIRTKSPILKEMEDKGEIAIVGGVYNMKTGQVDFFEK